MSDKVIFFLLNTNQLCKICIVKQSTIIILQFCNIMSFDSLLCNFMTLVICQDFQKDLLTGSKHFSIMYQELTPNCYPTHVILRPTKLSRQPKFYFREAICNCGLLKKRRSKTSKASLTSVIFHFRQRNSQKEVAQITLMGTKNYLSSILNCTTAISQECFDFEILDQT